MTVTRRHRWAGAAVVALALTTAACGGGGGDKTGQAKPPADGGDAFLNFTKCMRDEGVDMPDPEQNGDGTVMIGGEGSVDPNDPEFKAAEAKCKKHLGDVMNAGRANMPKDVQERLLKMAQCMREQGIDMPDPDPSGGTIGDAPDINNPAFAEASRVCQKKVGMPDVVNTGPGADR